MARSIGESGAGRLVAWIATPQILTIAIVLVVAAVAGHGFRLALLLIGAATVSSMLIGLGWKLLLRLRDPPYLIVGPLIGLLAGSVAGGAMVLAVFADVELERQWPDSLLGTFAEAAVTTGAEAGSQTLASDDPLVNAITLPHRAVMTFAGGFVGAMVMVALILFACALPLVSGLFGGLAAALAARRRARHAGGDPR